MLKEDAVVVALEEQGLHVHLEQSPFGKQDASKQGTMPARLVQPYVRSSQNKPVALQPVPIDGR